MTSSALQLVLSTTKTRKQPIKGNQMKIILTPLGVRMVKHPFSLFNVPACFIFLDRSPVAVKMCQKHIHKRNGWRSTFGLAYFYKLAQNDAHVGPVKGSSICAPLPSSSPSEARSACPGKNMRDERARYGRYGHEMQNRSDKLL